ncbi:hypothetical protein ACXX9E_29375 [Pseudomonas sp. GNP014]
MAHAISELEGLGVEFRRAAPDRLHQAYGVCAAGELDVQKKNPPRRTFVVLEVGHDHRATQGQGDPPAAPGLIRIQPWCEAIRATGRALVDCPATEPEQSAARTGGGRSCDEPVAATDEPFAPHFETSALASGEELLDDPHVADRTPMRPMPLPSLKDLPSAS